MGYAGLLWRCVLRSPIIYVIVAILVATMGVPALIPTLVWGDEMVRQNLASSLTLAEENEASGAYASAPQRLQDLARDELSEMRLARGATSRHDFWVHMYRSQLIQMEDANAGYLSADRLLLEADLAYFEGMSKLVEPREISDSTQMPATEFLSFALASTPGILWLLPAVVIAYALQRSARRGRLIDARTRSRARRLLSLCMVGLLLTFAVLVVAWALVLAPVMVRNGMGDPSYPVVLIRGGKVSVSTALRSGLGCVTLILLSNWFLVLLSTVISELTGRLAAGPAVALVLCAVPLSDSYFLSASVHASVLGMLPATYLFPSPTTGYVGGFFVDLTPGVQLSLAGGVGVLVGCAALALVVGVGSCGLRRMARGAILRGRGQVSC